MYGVWNSICILSWTHKIWMCLAEGPARGDTLPKCLVSHSDMYLMSIYWLQGVRIRPKCVFIAPILGRMPARRRPGRPVSNHENTSSRCMVCVSTHTSFNSNGPPLKSWVHLVLTGWPEASVSSSLSLGFLICKMGITIVPSYKIALKITHSFKQKINIYWPSVLCQALLQALEIEH